MASGWAISATPTEAFLVQAEQFAGVARGGRGHGFDVDPAQGRRDNHFWPRERILGYAAAAGFEKTKLVDDISKHLIIVLKPRTATGKVRPQTVPPPAYAPKTNRVPVDKRSTLSPSSCVAMAMKASPLQCIGIRKLGFSSLIASAV